MERVWPDTFVEEANLSVNVSALRKALGTQADGRPYIQTARPARLPAGRPRRAATRRGRPSLAVLPFRACPRAPKTSTSAVGPGRRPHHAPEPPRTAGRAPHERGPQVRRAPAWTRRRRGARCRWTRWSTARCSATGRACASPCSSFPCAATGRPGAETFEEEMTGLFAVQDAMAEQVARALDLELREPERRLLARRHTAGPRSAGGLPQGPLLLEPLHRPLAGEGVRVRSRRRRSATPPTRSPTPGSPTPASILGFSGMLPPSAAWERADTEARQALERDEGLAEAHVSLAYVALFQDWDWATARRELDRAAELGPHTAAVRQWRGVYLAMVGPLRRGRTRDRARAAARSALRGRRHARRAARAT